MLGQAMKPQEHIVQLILTLVLTHCGAIKQMVWDLVRSA